MDGKDDIEDPSVTVTPICPNIIDILEITGRGIIAFPTFITYKEESLKTFWQPQKET